MPKTINMPELHEIEPPPTQENGGRRGRIGWFVRGFAVAALLFGGFMAVNGYLRSAPIDETGRTIIVGH